MCGISICTGRQAIQTFQSQSDRGMDGLGIIFQDGNKLKVIHSLFQKGEKESLYTQQLLNIITSYQLMDKMCIFHHRKASVGSVTLRNVHPMCHHDTWLVQNGTNQNIKYWGKVEGLVETDDTDSFALAKYLSRCHTIHEKMSELAKLSRRIGHLGIVIVAQPSTLEFGIFSDGVREMDCHLDPLLISNYGDSSGEWTGYLVGDFSGKVITNNLKRVGKFTPAYSFPAHTTYTHQTHGYAHGY